MSAAATLEVSRQPTLKMFLARWMQIFGLIVVRRIDFLFLAMIALAAAIASAPPPPRAPLLAGLDPWETSSNEHLSLSGLSQP